MEWKNFPSSIAGNFHKMAHFEDPTLEEKGSLDMEAKDLPFTSTNALQLLADR